MKKPNSVFQLLLVLVILFANFQLLGVNTLQANTETSATQTQEVEATESKITIIENEQTSLSNEESEVVQEEVAIEKAIEEQQPTTITPAAVAAFATFEGVDLAGENAFEYTTREAQNNAKTLTVKAEFDGAVTITNRQIIIDIDNGLGLDTAPGMIPTSAKNEDWTFNAANLPVQLQGIITGATYTPNVPIYGSNIRSGQLVYNVAPGTTGVLIDLGFTLDMMFSANGGTKTFHDALIITTKSMNDGTEVTNASEKLESYVINGGLGALVYLASPATVSQNAGDSFTRQWYINSQGDGFPNSSGNSIIYDEIIIMYKVPKKMGVLTATSSNIPVEKFNHVVDRASDSLYDIVTVTLTEYIAGNFNQQINLNFKLSEDVPVDSNYTVSGTVKIKPYGDSVYYAKSDVHSQITKIAKPFENKLKPTLITNNSRVAYTPWNQEIQPLGGFAVVNEYAETVTDQKLRIQFNDSAIGVKAVDVPIGVSSPATNVVIKTTKGQIISIPSISGSSRGAGTVSARISLTNMGNIVADEYISEVTYESTNFTTNYGVNSQSRTFNNFGSLTGRVYGVFLNKPVSKLYSFDISTVAISDGDFEGNSAQHLTQNTQMQDTPIVTSFASTNTLGSSYFGGVSYPMSATYGIAPAFATTTNAYAYLQTGVEIFLREDNYLGVDKDSIKITATDGIVYSNANSNLVLSNIVDNQGYAVIKIALPNLKIGHSEETLKFKIDYNVKIKPSAPTFSMPANQLMYIKPINGTLVGGANNSNSYYNNPDIFDVDGDGVTSTLMGTLHNNNIMRIQAQKDFTVMSSANLNDGPWVSYDYDINKDIINLNPEGEAKYQLTVSNTSGQTINGYTALVPIPKAGEKTDLTPANPGDFNASEHLQKEAFAWTTSLLAEINTASTNYNYTLSYATTYATDKDSSAFVPWNAIANKDDICMVKIETTDAIVDNSTDFITFPLAISDPAAEDHAGSVNIYSSRIYRSIDGNSGYKPSEPIAIRLKTGSVHGTTFTDTNRNGQQDAGEPGLNGVTVTAYEVGTKNVVDRVVTKRINGVDGKYAFLGLDKTETVDIIVTNPVTDGSLRFSPTTIGGSVVTASSDNLEASITNIVPSSTESLTVAAGFISATVVTMNPQGGSTANGTIAKFPNEVITTEPTAVKTGYTFNGWYDEATGGSKIVFPYTVGVTNTTLYAQYIANQYTTTFDVTTNGGEGATPAMQTIASGNKVVEPAIPTKTGYTFTGWYDSATGGTKWNFDTLIPANNQTLYAQFTISSYTLSFDVDGVVDIIPAQTLVYDTLVTEPTAPSKTGYTFSGWYDAATGGTKWNFATDKMPAANKTLYAQFTKNTYTLTFDVEGNTTATVVAFDALAIAPTAPTKIGYTFLGWYDAATGGTKWNFATDKMPASNKTLYAQFSTNAYTVTFDIEAVTTEVSVEYDALVTEPTAPVKAGYTFLGWYDAATGGTKWNFATDKMPASNKTLYAQFTINEYQMTFNNQGEEVSSQITYDMLIQEPTAPTKIGYTFSGWYDAMTGGTKWNFATDKMPASNKTLYAQFNINTYTLLFDVDGDTTQTVVTFDTLVTEPVQPIKTGYTFLGWYDGATGGTKWNFATDKMPASNKTMYAQFSINAYTVTFDIEAVTTEVSVEYDALVAEPTAPVKAGYTFLGWYNAATSGTKWDFTTAKMPANAVTLYAQFVADNQTITFDVNGGLVETQPAAIIQPTDSSVDIDAITAPIRNGYQFIGWFDGDVQVSGTIKMPVDGLLLVAQWTANEQVITFNTNGGTGVATITAPTDAAVDIDAVVSTKAGYQFDGWFDGSTKIQGKISMPAGGLNLTAQWTATNQTITFDLNGGENQTKPNDIVQATDTDVNLDNIVTPTWRSYRFIGWFDALGVQYAGTMKMPANGLQLTAHWRDLIADGTWKIEATQFEMTVTELNDFVENETLEDEILERSQAKAIDIETGEILGMVAVDITPLVNTRTEGEYNLLYSYEVASNEGNTLMAVSQQTTRGLYLTEKAIIKHMDASGEVPLTDDETTAKLPETGENTWVILLSSLIVISISSLILCIMRLKTQKSIK